jgi:hypothetical protein
MGRTAFKWKHFPSDNQAHKANNESSILEKIYQDVMNAIARQFGLLSGPPDRATQQSTKSKMMEKTPLRFWDKSLGMCRNCFHA